MLRASSLLLLLALSAFRCCRSTKLVAKRLQVHRVRLHDSLVMSCAAKDDVIVTQARWTDQAGGTAWLSQALLSVSTGHLRFPKVAAVLSGHYECSGYVRLPRREVFIKVRHEIQVFDSDRNETGCRVGYVVNDQRCYVCRPGSFSPGGEFRNCIPCDFGSYTEQHGSPFCLWCPPGKSTYRQGSTSSDDCEVSWVIYAFLFGMATLTSLVLFVWVSRAWSSEQRVRTIVMEDKLSRFFQPKILPPSRSRASDRPAMMDDSRKPASFQEEQQPLLAATTCASRQAIGTQTDENFHVDSVDREVQTEPSWPMPPAASSASLKKRIVASPKAKVAAQPDQETMFKELLAKTAPYARRLDRRKNTPQPRHLGRTTLKAVGGSHRTLQKSPLAARKPANEFSSWRSPNRSAQRIPRKTGALAPVLSPPAETPVNLYGRPSHRSTHREFDNASRYKLPVWHSSPEDQRRTLHSARARYDVPRVVHGFNEAAEIDASDESRRSVTLYGRSGHVSPRRSPWHSPLGREDRHDHLSSVVSPPPRGYQMARRCRHGAPSEGNFVNEASHDDEELFIPPRGAYSAPGIRNRPGATHMFRCFGSTTAWVTDEYSKHKQQGPGYYGSPNA